MEGAVIYTFLLIIIGAAVSTVASIYFLYTSYRKELESWVPAYCALGNVLFAFILAFPSYAISSTLLGVVQFLAVLAVLLLCVFSFVNVLKATDVPFVS